MRYSSRRSRRLRQPLNMNIQESKPFFGKTSDTVVQKNENTPFFQTKLTIGQPGDKYEKEADAVANSVVNRINQPVGVQKKSEDFIQRVTLSTPQEDEKLGTAESAMEKDKEIQEKPEVQAMDKEEEMAQMQGEEEEEMAQMQGEEEEEMAQMQGEEEEEMAQMQGEEEEEMAQMQGEEEEEMAQMQGEEEEEMAQMQGEEEEEMAQMQGEEEEEMAQMQGEEEEEMVQSKKAGGTTARTATPQLAKCLKSTKGQGSPLPKKTRLQMEKAFGADLSKVKIHTGDDAVKMNKKLRAQAFTNGFDIYFNEGKFNPESTKGQQLLAHELTHVFQQKGKS